MKDEKLTSEIVNYWSLRSQGIRVATEILLNNSTILQSMLSRLIPNRGRLKVLDIGTGTGLMAIELSRMGFETHAVDMSAEMLAEAEDLAAKMGHDIRFSLQDVQNLDMGEYDFDIIVSKDCVWNLTDPEAAYRSWTRHLRPGGQLIVFDANYYLYHSSGEYRLRKEFFDEKYGVDSDLHGKTNVNNVDLSIIDDLAMDLPLSSRQRPSWDMEVLSRLGYTKFTVEVLDRENYTVRTPQGDVQTPMAFVISSQLAYDRKTGQQSGRDIEFEELRNRIRDESTLLHGALRCFSNETQLKLAIALCESPLTVSQAADLLGISQALASYNLNKMKSTRILTSSRNGQEITYAPVDSRVLRDLLNVAIQLGNVPVFDNF